MNQDTDRAHALLEQVGLADRRQHRLGQLSRGEPRRGKEWVDDSGRSASARVASYGGTSDSGLRVENIPIVHHYRRPLSSTERATGKS